MSFTREDLGELIQNARDNGFDVDQMTPEELARDIYWLASVPVSLSEEQMVKEIRIMREDNYNV